MGDEMVRRESAVEYFKELVDRALVHQGMQVQALTSYYVVQLLAGFLRRQTTDDEAVAMRLARAFESDGRERRANLRCVADSSLFVSGFFSNSLRRSLVDIDYYIAVGGLAYRALSRVETDTLSSVFGE